MIYQCQTVFRNSRFFKEVYRRTAQLNKIYNLQVRVSQRLEFFDQSDNPLGYIDLNGLNIKIIKEWDYEEVKQSAKAQNPKKSTKQQKSKPDPTKNKSSKRIESQYKQTENKFKNYFNFIIYKSGAKDKDDILILDIHTRSQGLKINLEKLAVTDQKSASPLSLQPSKKFNTSLMSSQNAEQRYRGFLNLAMILVLIFNIRNIVASVQKYGLQQLPSASMPYHSIIYLTLGFGSHLILSYLLTFLQLKNILPSISLILNLLIVAGVLISNVVYCRKFNPGFSTANILTMIAAIVSLKLISFIHFNVNAKTISDMIRKKQSLGYLGNIDQFVHNEIKANANDISGLITVYRFGYFILAPTLCYQLEYPRNLYIRKLWLLKRVSEFMICALLMNIIIAQNIVTKLQDMRGFYISESFTLLEFGYMIMQFSVSVAVFWVIMFYAVFHVLLNIIAELTTFGDRLFYTDWWNCKNLSTYWRKWNISVHNWLVRHVYIPLIGLGFSKMFANYAVFFVSAAYHEYWIGVPTGLITYWAFLAIMLQAPIIAFQSIFQKKFGLENSELGNATFWLTFCFIGQPIVAFAYYYLFTSK